jgi:hypothetical protein
LLHPIVSCGGVGIKMAKPKHIRGCGRAQIDDNSIGAAHEDLDQSIRCTSGLQSSSLVHNSDLSTLPTSTLPTFTLAMFTLAMFTLGMSLAANADAVAAHKSHALQLLTALHTEFPRNALFCREMAHLQIQH